jgi:solute carrier family 35 protein C2
MFSGEHLNFKFPLFTTCMHMLVQFSLASLVLYLFPRFRPRADSLTHPDSVYTPEEQRRRDLDTAEHKPLMTNWFYFTRLGPCGLSTGLDIGLGNMSLQFISLTFYSTYPPVHVLLPPWLPQILPNMQLTPNPQQCVNPPP